MSAGGFNTVHRTILVEWILRSTDNARKFAERIPHQQLYISVGAIKEAYLIEEAGNNLKNNQGLQDSDLTINVLNKEVASIKNNVSREKEAEKLARNIYKDIRKLIRPLQDDYVIYIEPDNIVIIGTIPEIRTVKNLLESQAAQGGLLNTYDYLNKTQIGHSIGFVSSMVNLSSNAFNKLGINIPKDVQKDIKYIMDMEFDSVFDRHISAATGFKGVFNLSLEFNINNNRGRATIQASKRVKRWVSQELAKQLQKASLTKREINTILSTGYSTSIEDDIAILIESVFLEKKLRNRKKLSKAKSSTQEKSRVKGKSSHLSIGKIVRSRRKRGKAPGLMDNLLDLKNIINANMHEILKSDVMGQGQNPDVLNYRTGRFARSARVENLIQSQGGLHAEITWQRYPYDTFAPGGKLHKPMRDPSYLIGKSVRTIMRDLGLARLNISTKAV